MKELDSKGKQHLLKGVSVDRRRVKHNHKQISCFVGILTQGGSIPPTIHEGTDEIKIFEIKPKDKRALMRNCRKIHYLARETNFDIN